MEKKKILIPIITLLIGLFLGFIFGQLTGQQAEKQIRQQVEGELQGLRGLIEEFWPIESEILSFDGKVKEIKTNSVLADILYVNPLEELPVTREVLVTDDTLIIKWIERDPVTYKREMEEYTRLEEELVAEIEAGIEPDNWPEFPRHYLETEITFNEIEPGSLIRVEAGQDIKWSERFTATKILVKF